MEYLKLFKTQAEAVGQTVKTPNVSTLEGMEKALYVPKSVGDKVKIIKDGDFINYYVDPYEYVDLGLSSGTLWANMNIGATKETDYGLFFQWGDTVGYDESTAAAHSTWSTCPGNGGASSIDTSALTTWNTANLTNNVLNTSVDAAYVHTNGKAKMPTEAQADELINETNNEWTTIDGVAGIKFTNKTDSSKYIFIPAAGYFDEGSRFQEGSYGIVWASSFNSPYSYCACKFEFDSSGPYTYYESYNYACCVRGVKNV